MAATLRNRPRHDRMGCGARHRCRRPRRRSRRRYDRIRSGTCPRRRRLELDHPAVRHARPRHRADGQARGAARRTGIDNKTTIVLYGDNNNWFAAWAFWQLKIYGHEDVRIMDGGRKKWLAEGRDLSTDTPSVAATTYKAKRARHLAARVPARGAGGGRRRRTRRSSTCAARRSSPARSSRRPGCPKPASAAATSPARRASRGRRRATTTARSRAATSLKALYGGAGHHRRQAGDRLLPHRRAIEPHLVRAEVPARLRATSRTTTDRGPSGATWSARRSRSRGGSAR